MNGKTKPYAILVFGAPLSGKSTFADKFSNSISAPYIDFEKLSKKHDLSRKTVIELIKIYARSKQPIVIEGMTNTETQRDEMREVLKGLGYRPVLIWVQTGMNDIKQRMLRRYKTLDKAKAAMKELYADVEALSDKETSIVISGKHTYQAQYQSVLNRLSDLQ